MLEENNLSPELPVEALRKLKLSHPEADKMSCFSTHPQTEERMRHLHDLAIAAAIK